MVDDEDAEKVEVASWTDICNDEIEDQLEAFSNSLVRYVEWNYVEIAKVFFLLLFVSCSYYSPDMVT